MPTPEQLKSRQEVDAFLDKVRRPIHAVSRAASAWFGRPKEELEGWIERGRAIAEIADSIGYRLIMTQANKEILWAQQQLEVCDEKQVLELRCYLKSLRFLKDFILTTEKNADISASVLAGRPGAIARETVAFVQNARVEDASQ